jgi:hypothetical protein
MELIIYSLTYYNTALGEMSVVLYNYETSNYCNSRDTLCSSNKGYNTSKLSTQSLL